MTPLTRQAGRDMRSIFYFYLRFLPENMTHRIFRISQLFVFWWLIFHRNFPKILIQIEQTGDKLLKKLFIVLPIGLFELLKNKLWSNFIRRVPNIFFPLVWDLVYFYLLINELIYL